MKHALLITYYWPPAGGPGVHRWLRFSKYFKENGWNLTVFCPENAEWPVVDPALENEVSKDLTVVRFPIWEPHKYLGKKNNPNKGGAFTRAEKPSLAQQVIMWVRGNLFIPDARKFWVNPSANFLENYLKERPEISTVITTGPPHSLHLIGLRLKRKLKNITWLADFRDPWTQIDFYHELMLGKRADAIHHKLEKEVLTEADVVVSISKGCADGLEQIGGRKVEVITNGFEFEEFDGKQIKPDNKFSIAHIGSMPESRNPQVVWDALKIVLQEIPALKKELEIKLIGPVDVSIFSAIKKAGLDEYLNHIPQVSHKESLEIQKRKAILLLVANNTGNSKGTLTGKFFEYLGAQRPILAIGEKDSDLHEAIHYTQSGVFESYTDIQKTVSDVKEYYNKWKAGQLYITAQGLSRYNSSGLASEFCKLMETDRN